jgi:hypothetical protein
MRKEDRIRAGQQSSGDQTHEPKATPEPRESEGTRGSAGDESRKPERPNGRLPLPD